MMFKRIKFFFFLTNLVNGRVSKIELSPFGIRFRKLLLNIKYPPLIQLVFVVDFP